MAQYAQHGDPQAFRQLFDGLAPRIHGFFRRTFRDPATADDLLQQTFLKLHRARKRYREGAKVRPWVFTIAARVKLDELRRRGRSRESGSEDSLAAAESRLAREAPDAPDAAVRSEVQEQVRAAMEQLTDAQRVVVELHRFEGMSYPEIAEVLGSTPGAIKLRAFRAYGQLRKLLAPIVEADDEKPVS